MPIAGNLTIIGAQQGQIEGSCDLEDREGTIAVLAWDHLVEIPSDSRGVATGRRVHRPMTITKEIDRSSAMCYQALCTGERLLEVTLDWYRIDETGDHELYFQVQMQNALISAMKPWVPNTLDPEKTGFRHMEDMSIIYERISWTWMPDGVEFEDTWGEVGKDTPGADDARGGSRFS